MSAASRVGPALWCQIDSNDGSQVIFRLEYPISEADICAAFDPPRHNGEFQIYDSKSHKTITAKDVEPGATYLLQWSNVPLTMNLPSGGLSLTAAGNINIGSIIMSQSSPQPKLASEAYSLLRMDVWTGEDLPSSIIPTLVTDIKMKIKCERRLVDKQLLVGRMFRGSMEYSWAKYEARLRELLQDPEYVFDWLARTNRDCELTLFSCRVRFVCDTSNDNGKRSIILCGNAPQGLFGLAAEHFHQYRLSVVNLQHRNYIDTYLPRLHNLVPAEPSGQLKVSTTGKSIGRPVIFLTYDSKEYPDTNTAGVVVSLRTEANHVVIKSQTVEYVRTKMKDALVEFGNATKSFAGDKHVLIAINGPAVMAVLMVQLFVDKFPHWHISYAQPLMRVDGERPYVECRSSTGRYLLATVSSVGSVSCGGADIKKS